MHSCVCLATRAAPQACLQAAPRRVNRRAVLQGFARVTAAGASVLASLDEAPAPLDRSLSDAVQLARTGSSGGLRRSSSGLQRQHSSNLGDLAVGNVLPAPRLRPTAQPERRGRGISLPAPHATAPVVAPRVLQLQSTEELRQLVLSHTRRLLVIHLTLAACPFSDAFQPMLERQAAALHPDALLGRLALSTAADSAAEQLLQGLGIDSLPCTLLLWSQQVLSKLQVEDGTAPQEAARDLRAALLAASKQMQLRRVDCAAGPVAPRAAVPEAALCHM